MRRVQESVTSTSIPKVEPVWLNRLWPDQLSIIQQQQWRNTAAVPPGSIITVPPKLITPDKLISHISPYYITTSYTDREYIYGPSYVDEFVAQVDRYGNSWYVLQDGNFNVTGLVNAMGNLVHQYTYSPYGQIVAQEQLSSHPVNRILHQGIFWDSAVGLYYNRNRWYDPELGRFIQKDPNLTAMPIIMSALFNAQSFEIELKMYDLMERYEFGTNLFEYLGSNPNTRLDPSGLAWTGFDAALTVGIFMGAYDRTKEYPALFDSQSIGGSLGGKFSLVVAGWIAKNTFTSAVTAPPGTGLSLNHPAAIAIGGLVGYYIGQLEIELFVTMVDIFGLDDAISFYQ
ncbi:MAG: hypothetical protein HJJLKODD_00565 [Phycisphaerae bacterium]|nr:hypothetical protein [Phycisphaerae bacterium]